MTTKRIYKLDQAEIAALQAIRSNQPADSRVLATLKGLGLVGVSTNGAQFLTSQGLYALRMSDRT